MSTPPELPQQPPRTGRGGFGKKPPKTPTSEQKPPPVPGKAAGGLKRSHMIALGAGGVLVAAAVFGGRTTETEPNEKAAIFSSVAECKNEGVVAPDVCETQFNAASYTHVERAPKFTSQAECEAQYGSQNCWSRPFSGANVFVPAMVGFMIANHLSNARSAQALLPPLRGATPCPPGQTPATMPGCVAQPTRSSSSSSTTSSWRSYSNAAGYAVSRSTTRGGAVSTVQRGATSAPTARSTIGGVSSRSATSSSSRSSTSSSSTVSRGGFGSTARSSSSS